jgi:hypothetical protein
MPLVDLTVAMPSDWLKWYEDGWYSPENGILKANSGTLLSGTVLAVDGTGKLVPLAPAGTAPTNKAIGILFLNAANSTVDTRVSYIAREVTVADKALRFPGGTTDPQKTTAYADLKAVGILVRQGV